MTGEWPTEDVDHKFGERADNRWAKLRPATRQMNTQNRVASRAVSGYMGAHFCRRNGLYESRIMANRKRWFLGYFTTAKEANAAYLRAKSELHVGFIPER